jgi:two-component system nitrogen regulation response regulator NtrX
VPEAGRPHAVVLLGLSQEARRQSHELGAVAPADRAVLIVGEPGLEHESVARALHEARGAGSFVVVNCGASRPADLHARLFGGPEAAASRRRDLEVVTRDGALSTGTGTIVLQDVVELPAAVQRRLTRVLRDGEMYAAQVRRAMPLHARIVATATPDIQDEVAAGRFRSDLYRRLSTRRIVLAPLRERPEDVPAIVHAIAEALAAERETPARVFTPAALTALAALPWRRNLAELRELVERLHALEPGAPARQEDVLKGLGFGVAAAPPLRFDSLRDARKRFEREYIAAVLARHAWRIAEAAATLGIERANLYRKIRQLGLSRPSNGAA